MKNLFNLFKKITKQETREWYTAEKELDNGFRFKTGVRANSEEEAIELIQHNSHGKILKIYKGDL